MIIHDRRLPKEYKQAISKKFSGQKLVPFILPNDPCQGVYPAINGHPDIYCMRMDKNMLVVAPIAERFFRDLDLSLDLELVRGELDPCGEYPSSARYNAVRFGRRLMHNFEITDVAILERSEKLLLEKIDVRQGYARCSSIPVGENALLTSDRGIERVASSKDLEVMYVDPTEVILDGYSHGFIGGASGIVNERSIFFCGDLSEHAQSEQIIDFCEKRDVDVLCLKDLPLYDVGTLLFLH